MADEITSAAVADPAQAEADEAMQELAEFSFSQEEEEEAPADVGIRDVRAVDEEDQVDEDEDVEPTEWRSRYETAQQEAETARQEAQGLRGAVDQIRRVMQVMQSRYEEQRSLDQELAAEIEAERRAGEAPEPGTVEWLDHRLRTQEELIRARFEEQQARERAAQEQAQTQQILTSIDASIRQATEDWPEMPEALAHLEWAYQVNLHASGQDPALARQQLLAVAANALVSGQDPAETLYTLAVTAGFEPPPDDGDVPEEVVERAAPAQSPLFAARQERQRSAAARSEPRAKSPSAGRLTQRDVQGMTDAEMQEFFQDHPGGFEAAVDEIMSPFNVS